MIVIIIKITSIMIFLLLLNKIVRRARSNPKCESEAQIVNRKEKMQLDIQVLESLGEIKIFYPVVEGRK